MARFTIADLIDLECRYLIDRQADPDHVAARDRAFVAAYEQLPGRAALIHAWLRHDDHDLPGRRWLAAVRQLSIIAWLGMAVLGGLVAAGALTGTSIDLFLAIGILLGIQLLFLLLLLLAPLLGAGAGPLVEALIGGLLRIGPLRSWVQRHGGEAILARLRMRLTLRRDLLRWFILGLTQRASVAYNCGIILILGLRVAFADIRFSWSTSLPPLEQAERITAWADALATPWSWAWSTAVPDLRLVLGSMGPGAGGSELRWWPWLLMLILVYGLLVRMATATLASLRCRGLLAALPGDDAETLAVHQRLVDAFRNRVEARQQGDERGHAPLPTAPTATVYSCLQPIAWLACPISDEAAGAFIERRYQAGATALTTLDAAIDQAPPPGCDAHLLLVEAWQVPSRKCLRHLRELRQHIGPASSILVCLLGGEAPQWTAPTVDRIQLWQRHLAAVGDAHLQVVGYAP